MVPWWLTAIVSVSFAGVVPWWGRAVRRGRAWCGVGGRVGWWAGTVVLSEWRPLDGSRARPGWVAWVAGVELWVVPSGRVVVMVWWGWRWSCQCWSWMRWWCWLQRGMRLSRSVCPPCSQGVMWWIWQWLKGVWQWGQAQLRWMVRRAVRWVSVAVRWRRPTARGSPFWSWRISWMRASQQSRVRVAGARVRPSRYSATPCAVVAWCRRGGCGGRR